jgi:uncharacterized OB-fold protein
MTEEVLSSPHVVEYTYTRSVGPVLERFFTGLGRRRIEGIRCRDGRVMVPPAEYDPATGESLHEWVPVGEAGVVTTWAWTNEPLAGQPLDHPFGWALIRLDGADTALLHAVDAGEESRMSTGMRVKARWRQEPVDDLGAIECFEPEDGR